MISSLTFDFCGQAYVLLGIVKINFVKYHHIQGDFVFVFPQYKETLPFNLARWYQKQRLYHGFH